MTPENYDKNMRFALDTAKKALERIKTQVQELEAAVSILDTTRFLVATEGLEKTEAASEQKGG